MSEQESLEFNEDIDEDSDNYEEEAQLVIYQPQQKVHPPSLGKPTRPPEQHQNLPSNKFVTYTPDRIYLLLVLSRVKPELPTEIVSKILNLLPSVIFGRTLFAESTRAQGREKKLLKFHVDSKKFECITECHVYKGKYSYILSYALGSFSIDKDHIMTLHPEKVGEYRCKKKKNKPAMEWCTTLTNKPPTQLTLLTSLNKLTFFRGVGDITFLFCECPLNRPKFTNEHILAKARKNLGIFCKFSSSSWDLLLRDF